MALKLETQYPTRTTVDANNPNGTFKNSDPVGSLNGTPGDFAWAKDMWSFLEILMTLGSVTHSGAPDDANSSQRYDALVKIGRNVWPLWDSTHTYPAGVIVVGSDNNPYYSLQASNTNQDPTSNPTWWRNFSFEALQSAARNVWPIWDSANIYPQGVGAVGSDGKPYHSLQSTNFNHDPTSSPTWWQTAFLSPATKTSKGTAYLGDQRIILSNNISFPADDIDFSGGRFTFDDGTGQSIAPTWTKELDSAFVAGDGNGGRIGALGDDTWFYCFAIYSPVDGLSDYIMAASFTPSLPGTYTKKRYIGAIRRQNDPQTGAPPQRIEPFSQYEKTFRYKTRILDLDLSGVIGTTAVLQALTTPSAVETEAQVIIMGGTTVTKQILVTDPSEVDIAPTDELFSLYLPADNSRVHTEIFVRTDNSGRIRYRSSSANVAVFLIQTLGWIDFNLED